MDLTQQIDIYCERLGPGLWAEPWNALTNLAFLVGAAWAASRLRGQRLPYAWAMAAFLALIGIGSGLFHTFATTWAVIADVTPILGFVLTVILATVRTLLRWPLWLSILATVGFFPYAAAGSWAAVQIPALAISASYWPIFALILAVAFAIRGIAPIFARGLAVVGALLLLSLTFRSIDETLCAHLPHGTHFLWHLLNATLLSLVIDAYRRQMLASPRAPR